MRYRDLLQLPHRVNRMVPASGSSEGHTTLGVADCTASLSLSVLYHLCTVGDVINAVRFRCQ